MNAALIVQLLTDNLRKSHFIGTAYDNIILKHANVRQTLASTQKEIEPLLNP